MSIQHVANRYLLPGVFSIGLALCMNAPTQAADGSFGHPVRAVFPFGSAFLGGTINLKGVGTGGFTFEFVLPRDYRKNRKVAVVLYLSVPSNFTPCIAIVVPQQLARQRPGEVGVNNLAGLTAAGGDTVFFPSGGETVQKVFNIRKAGTFPGQKVGDELFIGIQRKADEPADTCGGDAFVHAIDILYPLQP